MEEVSHCDGFQGQSLNKQAAFVLSMACTNCILLNHLIVQCGVPDLVCYSYCSLHSTCVPGGLSVSFLFSGLDTWTNLYVLVLHWTFLCVLAPYGVVHFNND